MRELLRPARNALRSLKRAPGFTALVLAVLGVGTGSTIFMFGVLKAYVLTPLPFPKSQELMHLGMEDPVRGEEDLEVYPLDFLDWREHQEAFTGLAGYYEGTVNLSGPGSDRPERYQGAFLTGDAFELLGVQAHRGRTLEPRDSAPGAPDVVLLGHEDAYPSPDSRARFFRELTGRLGERPGALSAAAATALPGTDDDETRYALRGGGATDVQYARHEPAYWSVTTPGLFRMLEIPLLRGRLYDERDRADTEPVAVVTRDFAEAAWPTEEALGRQVALSEAEDPERFRTVIGVVDDVHLAEADDPSRPAVFVPMSQNPVRFAYSAVRTAGDPLAFSDAMRQAVLFLDPDLPVYWLQTLDWWIAYGGWTDKLVALHFEAFGAIALILAAVGLYGVLAYAVAQRTREIGVRRALGADDARIAGDMARQTLGQLAVGLGFGLVLGFAFAQVLGSSLIGVETGDPLTYVAVVLLLAAVSAAAVAGPTLRALRVHPVEALRQG